MINQAEGETYSDSLGRNEQSRLILWYEYDIVIQISFFFDR